MHKYGVYGQSREGEAAPMYDLNWDRPNPTKQKIFRHATSLRFSLCIVCLPVKNKKFTVLQSLKDIVILLESH